LWPDPREKENGPGPRSTMPFSYLFKKKIKRLELIWSKEILPLLQSSNKIWIYRELNKEQLSLLELFKIRDRIWIKKWGSSRVWNSIEFDGIWMKFFLNWWNLGKELLFAFGW
jgi:hypothetical protein